MSSPSENYTEVNGLKLCWFEWGREHRNAGTTLLLHATGFHARCWDKTIDNLPGRHIVAFDLRGHGRSDKPIIEKWASFADDCAALIEQLDLQNITGVGHSMGGNSLIATAARLQDRFQRLVLIDPVVFSPEFYRKADNFHDRWLDSEGEHPVARRRNHFADAQAIYDSFHGRGSYASWRDDVLRDYCEYGSLPNPDGDGVILACPPRVEASIYMTSFVAGPHDAVTQIKLPVTVARARAASGGNAKMDFTNSPTWDGLADAFADGHDIHLPEQTHFIPMEAPELTAKIIREAK